MGSVHSAGCRSYAWFSACTCDDVSEVPAVIPFSNQQVAEVFDGYPERARVTMLALRDLVFTVAEEAEIGGPLTEALKWGEPSYLCETGSTLRMHWKDSDPEHCRVFFHCQTKLVETFRELYPEEFEFEGNRAIRLGIGADVDLEKLGHCMELSLRYHQLKHLPGLGASQSA